MLPYANTGLHPTFCVFTQPDAIVSQPSLQLNATNPTQRLSEHIHVPRRRCSNQCGTIWFQSLTVTGELTNDQLSLNVLPLLCPFVSQELQGGRGREVDQPDPRFNALHFEQVSSLVDCLM